MKLTSDCNAAFSIVQYRVKALVKYYSNGLSSALINKTPNNLLRLIDDGDRNIILSNSKTPSMIWLSRHLCKYKWQVSVVSVSCSCANITVAWLSVSIEVDRRLRALALLV
jgi:hypothetical protein